MINPHNSVRIIIARPIMMVPWVPATVNNAPSDSIRAATHDMAIIGSANTKVPGLNSVPPKRQ